MRAVQGLRDRGHQAGLIIHRTPDETVPAFLAPLVVAEVISDTPLDQCNGSFEHMIPTYRDAIETMHATTGLPVVISPNLHGDCYGIIAALTQSMPDRIRVVSWLHSDNRYDIAVATYYEPVLHDVVVVSSELHAQARKQFACTSTHLSHIPYSVDVASSFPVRSALRNRPLRLVYSGRLNEEQKRVSALPVMCRTLVEQNINFELRVIGDGESRDKLIDASRDIPQVQLLGSVSPHHVVEHLQWADAWVLPSRYEGQSVAMLEAMGQGCIPVITRVESGAADAVAHGERGLIADVPTSAGHQDVGFALAQQIRDLVTGDMNRMARNAWEYAKHHHNHDIHVQRLCSIIERAQQSQPKQWLSHRPVTFKSATGNTASATEGAKLRLAAILKQCIKARVAIYGAGQHTIDLAQHLSSSDAECVVCVFDDDTKKHGSSLWGWRVLGIEQIAHLGITDVIISSRMHESALRERCIACLPDTISIHTLYSDTSTLAEPKPDIRITAMQ